MKELTEIVDFGISLGNALGKSFENGKLDVGDTVHLWGVATTVAPAIKDSDEAWEEFKNRTPEQTADLIAHVKEKFDIPQDDIEEAIEDGIDVSFRVIKYARKFAGKFVK